MNECCAEKNGAPKTKDVSLALLEMGRVRGPGIKLPTIEEMCAQFEVSRTTIERALEPLERRGLFRRRRGSGIYVSPTIHQKTIAVVFGGNIFSAFYSPFWLLQLQAVNRQAAERKHRTLAYLDIPQAGEGLGGHAQLIEDLENRRIHGIVLLAPAHGVDESRQFGAYGVPVVVFGGKPSDWTVTHDWLPLLSLSARELVAHGCRRVALLGDAKSADHQVLKRNLREAGYRGEPLEDWAYDTWASRIPGPFNRELFGCELARRMIADRANTPLPDGLVSLDDTMTRGVITALLQAGLQPGRDIQIVTSANKGSPVLEPYASDLIQIEYDPAASMSAMLDMLETLMNGSTPSQNPVLIAPVVREVADRWQNMKIAKGKT